ncbi:RNA polymerase sigma-70 factor [Pedobacter sp. MC2016-05]|uniref:RNA polymerase sigma factor n=1 Tax=Pedobacter sp. MC2016-05 TaxID=2994474 RepID=UPI0012148D83|nr:RNA polymerase sigma-70 factor [Pedobacter sp. MC2016-05]MCX2475863.1 RNA polymerase sigma-70 factor [Pedobacter sp. MC2016-05]RZK68216.1 MAG: RNA polymerase sigma-70 factor [Pedobacter sp.]
MSVYNLSAEKILLQKIAGGDEIAFKHVFELYKNRVYSFVVRFVHSKADAEEIVQDTFFTIWQKRDTLPNIEHPRNYIYTIVRNKTYNYLNQAAKNQKILAQLWANMQVESNGIEEQTDFKDSEMLINRGLANLSEQKQQIFKMSRFDGLSHEEIALQVGLSKSRVKNVIVDVLKYLRHYLSINTLKISITAYFVWLLS